nr:abscisic acid 8'-hydroxylase 2 [Tanacetum cinerariifolium]
MDGLKRLYYCLEKGYNSMPLDLPGTPFKKAMKSYDATTHFVSTVSDVLNMYSMITQKRYFMGHVTSIARAGYSVGRTRSRCDGSRRGTEVSVV